MTNDKPTTATAQTAGPARAPASDNTLPGEKKDVKVLSLSIDENDDPGSDPYNRTGSFCVPEFQDD